MEMEGWNREGGTRFRYGFRRSSGKMTKTPNRNHKHSLPFWHAREGHLLRCDDKCRWWAALFLVQLQARVPKLPLVWQSRQMAVSKH